MIHRIWLGGNPLPAEFERYGETWREHHPGWELRLWTDSNLPELEYRELFDQGRNPAERADVLRQELLLRFGGVYVDTDVECLRSIEPLIDGVRAFAAWSHRGRIGNAVLGAEPGHPAIERILHAMRGRVGKGNVIQATGPLLVTEVLADAPDVTLFGPETFYPFSPRDARPADASALEGAYAVHHWEASWKTREELQEFARRLKQRVDRLEEKNAKLERSRGRLRKRASKARAQNRQLEARLRRTRRRLRAIERSRWWRLRARLAGGARRVRRVRRRRG